MCINRWWLLKAKALEQIKKFPRCVQCYVARCFAETIPRRVAIKGQLSFIREDNRGVAHVCSSYPFSRKNKGFLEIFLLAVDKIHQYEINISLRQTYRTRLSLPIATTTGLAIFYDFCRFFLALQKFYRYEIDISLRGRVVRLSESDQRRAFTGAIASYVKITRCTLREKIYAR